jgi:FtsH-binding integral membrane protein
LSDTVSSISTTGEMNTPGNEGTDTGRKTAIFGALRLYLDFINLFLSLLRLTGCRR